MRLFALLRRESPVSIGRIALMAVLSGIVNAVLLGVINAAAGSPERQTSTSYLLSFCLIIALFIVAQQYILQTSTLLVETVLNNTRNGIVQLIRDADLGPLENVGRAAIYSVVSQQMVTISNAAASVVVAAQSVVMIAFSVFYLALLSRAAFFLTVAIAGLAFYIHYREVRQLTAASEITQKTETSFFALLTGLLEGFKEVKMNRQRSDDLAADMVETSNELAQLKIVTGERFARAFVFAQTVFYVLIATIVFILPRFNQADTPIVTKAAATILFIIGPLSNLASAIPAFSNANVAVAAIERIEAVLAEARSRVPLGAVVQLDLGGFETITLENVVYRYLDKQQQPLFTLGPVNLTIRRGETIFLIGGNGSGKSTLLKILTSLYYPHSGRILVDGRPLTPEAYRAYRALFAPIFVDYHVFKTLYGLRPVDPERAAELLRLLEIDDKTAVVDDRFTNTDLSTGQRKRLAMLIALLEQRPIHVLDEWAADQDPVFRRFFYERLLRDMKAQGKTILAATHDDHYFDVADRVLKLENGLVTPYLGELGGTGA